MRILVTRPEPDAHDLAQKLAELGHTAVIDSLLQVETLPVDPSLFEEAGAIIATSGNAIRALEDSPALATARRLKLYAVGQRTEAKAHAAGMTEIITGPGTARELANLVIADTRAGGPPLVYLAGARLAFDLAPILEAAGRTVRQVTAYRTVAAKSLHPETISQFLGRGIDAVVLLSPRTASVYARLVQRAGLERSVRAVHHVCLSPAVAAPLAPILPESVWVAQRPTIEELLALLAPRRHTPPRIGQ